MKRILVVESSPLGVKSMSRRLTKDILDELLTRHPGSEVTIRDLTERPLPHLTAEHLVAFSTPPEKRDAPLSMAAQASDQAVEELLAADIVIIGAPMWNFGLPSALKAWIDHVVRAGRTFAYGTNGPRGLATGRKVYVAMASGGIYSQGPSQANDFVASYLRAVLSFIGIGDVSFVRAEGLAIPQVKDAAYEKAHQELVGLIANDAPVELAVGRI